MGSNAKGGGGPENIFPFFPFLGVEGERVFREKKRRTYLVFCPIILMSPLEVLEDTLDSGGDRIRIMEMVTQNYENLR